MSYKRRKKRTTNSKTQIEKDHNILLIFGWIHFLYPCLLIPFDIINIIKLYYLETYPYGSTIMVIGCNISGTIGNIKKDADKTIEKLTNLDIKNPQNVFYSSSINCIIDHEDNIIVMGEFTNIGENNIGKVKIISNGIAANHVIMINHENKMYGIGHVNVPKLLKGDKNKMYGIRHKIDQIKSIKCGLVHTLLLCHDGIVFGLGSNSNGEIGMGNEIENFTSPIKIDGLENISYIECGILCSFFLSFDGSVYYCGYWLQEVSWFPTKMTCFSYGIKQLNVGEEHFGVINFKDQVFMWGNNNDGQCGIDNDGEYIKEPGLLKLKEKIKFIRCGRDHTILITRNNNLYSFGCNDYQQCILSPQKYGKKLTKPQFIKSESIFHDNHSRIIDVITGNKCTLIVKN